MNIDGLILTIIVILSIVLLVAISPLIKKFLNNYIFWVVISLAILVYCIVFRFYDDWVSLSNAIDNNLINNPHNNYNQSIIISKALLLDLCPFFALAIPVFLIIQPSRKIASTLAPLSLFGALITIVGQIPFDNSVSLTIQYIFVGTDLNPIYFMMHFLNILVATLVLLNTPSLKFNGFLKLNYYTVIYFLYVGIMMAATGVNWNVSGMSPNDWTGIGEYQTVGQLLNLDYPYSMIVGYLLAYLGTCLIITMNDLVFKKMKYWSYPVKKNNNLNYYSFN